MALIENDVRSPKSPTTVFFWGAGGVLLVTGMAKMGSCLGQAKILDVTDPLTGIQFRFLLFLVGVLEAGAAAACFFAKSRMFSAAVVAALSWDLVIYRIALIWIGYHRPCSCLGNLTDFIHISPDVADIAMQSTLACLMVGSHAVLLSGWYQMRLRRPV